MIVLVPIKADLTIKKYIYKKDVINIQSFGNININFEFFKGFFGVF